MDIPVHALVQCKDGDFGHTTCLIVNPIHNVITHFVVNDRRIFGREHIVPISYISRTTEEIIIVDCDRSAILHMPSFIEYEFDRLDDVIPYREDHVYWPILVLEEAEAAMLHKASHQYKQIPVESLGIRRSMSVYAAAENEDGERTDQAYFGKVKAFVADPATGYVTHLVVHKVALTEPRDVMLPLKSIRKTNEEEVLLNLLSQEVDALPFLRVKSARGVCV